jgi:hypothetical protein
MLSSDYFRGTALAAALLLLAGPSAGEDKEVELALKLQNPVAKLISVPIQNNWDFGIGPAQAMRYTLNVQPVIPFAISDDWNLVTRTIVPFVHAESPVPGGPANGGIGDILQTFFFSPNARLGGWIVGVGPAMLYPSASDHQALGFGQWAAGPSAVALQQNGGWTLGLLVNHLWSYAGWTDNRVNATFMQPFVSYTTSTSTSFGINTETTLDWTQRQWTVPINVILQQLVQFGDQPVAFALAGRYYPEVPDYGPDWGLRFGVTLLFPK